MHDGVRSLLDRRLTTPSDIPATMIKLTILVPTVLACAAVAAAQVNPGARVRVLLNPSETAIVGTLDTLGTYSLRLEREGEAGIVTIPLWDLRRLEVSAGRHSYRSTGMSIGVLLGIGAGVAVALGSQKDCNNTLFSTFCDLANATAIAAIPIGGLAGVALGAVVGSAFHGERWTKVPLAHVAMAPIGSGRMGIGFSIPL